MASIEGRPLSLTLARFGDAESQLIGCSPGFLDLCGLDRQEVIGRNCRFLNQRTHVPNRLRDRIRQSVRTGIPFLGVIDNMRHLGRGRFEIFENLLHLVVVVAGSRRYILGIQSDVTGLNLKLTDGSQDALRLKKMFDSVLCAGVDSWIHIQEGSYHAPPTYLYIRHNGPDCQEDEVEIVEGDADLGDKKVAVQNGVNGRRAPPSTPDQYLVLAPEFSRLRQDDDSVNCKFLLFGEPPCSSGHAATEEWEEWKAFQQRERLDKKKQKATEQRGPTGTAQAVRLRDLPLQVSPDELGPSSANNPVLPRQGLGLGSTEPATVEHPSVSPSFINFSASGDLTQPKEVSCPLTTGSVKSQLQELQHMDPATVIIVRGINKLVGPLPAILTSHFSKYGVVRNINIPLVNKKRRGGPPCYDKKRAPGRGFIVMNSPEDAFLVLAQGSEQEVCGVNISVGLFTAKAVGES